MRANRMLAHCSGEQGTRDSALVVSLFPRAVEFVAVQVGVCVA